MARPDLVAMGAERRVAILGYVRDFAVKVGYSPSIAEIAAAVGLTSPNSTRAHLQRLASEGYLSITPRQPRAISLVEPGPDGWTRT